MNLLAWWLGVVFRVVPLADDLGWFVGGTVLLAFLTLPLWLPVLLFLLLR